jgi:hypothetical protein
MKNQTNNVELNQITLHIKEKRQARQHEQKEERAIKTTTKLQPPKDEIIKQQQRPAPVLSSFGRFCEHFITHITSILLAMVAMVLYYLTETYPKIAVLSVYIYLCSGIACNVVFTFYILPYIPKKLWDALTSMDEGDDAATAAEEEENAKKCFCLRKRKWIRIQCYLFAIIMGGISMLLYHFTTSHYNETIGVITVDNVQITTTVYILDRVLPWYQRIWYIFTYWFSGLSGNAFLYLFVLPHLPHKLKTALHDNSH